VLLADGIIAPEHLDLKIQPAMDLEFTLNIDNMLYDGSSLKTIVKRVTVATEQKLLDQVIKYTNGNKAKAARMLNVDYKTIHTKLKKLGIS
jgi:two-component system nitrogen regulation response regulator GlnG